MDPIHYEEVLACVEQARDGPRDEPHDAQPDAQRAVYIGDVDGGALW